MNKFKEKINDLNKQLDILFELPEIEELSIIFGFASICVFILFLVGSQVEITGFAFFGVVIFWIVWCEIQIYYRNKREKNKNVI